MSWYIVNGLLYEIRRKTSECKSARQGFATNTGSTYSNSRIPIFRIWHLDAEWLWEVDEITNCFQITDRVIRYTFCVIFNRRIQRSFFECKVILRKIIRETFSIEIGGTLRIYVSKTGQVQKVSWQKKYFKIFDCVMTTIFVYNQKIFICEFFMIDFSCIAYNFDCVQLCKYGNLLLQSLRKYHYNISISVIKKRETKPRRLLTLF